MRNIRRGKRRHLAALAVIGALGLVACSSSDDGDDGGSADAATTTAGATDTSTSGSSGGDADFQAVEDAAAEEGSVNFVTTFPGTETTVKEAFEASHPDITVNAERIQSIDAIPRLDQEAATGADGADVVLVSGEDWFIHNSEAGNLTAPSGPEVERWQGSEFFHDDYVIGAILPMVFGFNTTMVDEPFDDYEGFLDPSLKGRYSICDTEGPPVISHNQWLVDERGEDFVQQLLHDNEPVVYRSSSAAAEALAAGEIAAAQCMTPGAIQPLIDEGAPLVMTIPKPEAFALPGGLAITGWSKRPNAAQVFMDWLLSTEGQTALIEGLGTSASPLGDVEADDVVDVDSLHVWATSEFTPERYDELRAHFQSIISG